MAKNNGKELKYDNSIFDDTVKLVCGDNCLVKQEHIIHILELGIKGTIFYDILPKYLEKGWSYGSSETLRKYLSPTIRRLI